MKHLTDHETKKRGTLDFPAELYHVDIFHPRYTMPMHWHMECELIYVLEGSLRLTMNGVSSTLRPGEAVYIPSGVLHGATPDSCVYECFVYDPEHFFRQSTVCWERYADWAGAEGSRPKRCDAGSGEEALIRALFQSMYRRENGYEFIVTGLLWQLTGRMIARSSGESGGSGGRQTGPVKQALRRIRRDYGKHLTLEDLAEEAGMAPRYFCRVFRDMTGRTPVDYLNYYRTECAAELLCDTDESVLEISMTCGFADPAYFSRVFRRYKGISATAYRKSSRQAGKESL